MRNYPNALKRKLLDTICQMREELSKHTTDPKRDFTRNRKLPFGTLCRTILSMSVWNGYTLLAVNGSHVQIPSNIHDEATCFSSTKDGRGYNLLHLNALYDLESQLYLDTGIQDGWEEYESRALVELVDRSKLAEPVVPIADCGYEAYNNMAHIEQKGWKYLIRVKDRQGILSGLRLPDALEFAAVFSTG